MNGKKMRVLEASRGGSPPVAKRIMPIHSVAGQRTSVFPRQVMRLWVTGATTFIISDGEHAEDQGC